MSRRAFARIRPRREHAFQRSKAFDDPVMIPSINLGLFVLELTPQILQGDEIVERVDIARDQLSNRP